jgi:hypothetical protein
MRSATLAERLLDFSHLRAGKVPDLGGEALERGGRKGERREQLRMAISRDHLSRDGLGLESQTFAGDALDLGIDLCVGPDRSGQLPDAIRLERPRDACARAIELERPAGKLPAERCRLRMNAVRAADADGVAVLLRSRDDRGERIVDSLEDQAAGVLHLQGQRCVDDVG